MAALPDGDEVIGVPDLPEVGDVYGLKFGLWQDHPSTYKRGTEKGVSECNPVSKEPAGGRHICSGSYFEQQEAMIRRWPPSEVTVMDTDHNPFFSAPEHLLELILKSL
ncbi:methylesterase 17-like [Phragmites australis]|uniref:methylesterase 17-like n=1 Tax=Phragmites australis TaxID=29695 RepID=UPI002D793E24|nr:methylesterase 17-like [Phragmites australis]